MSLAQYSKEELQELSLIEMAFEYMKNSKQPIAFNELLSQITKAVGMSDKEIRTRLAQFYTDMNVDGRFLSLGDNRWGLRVWYPVDTAEEEVVTVVKPKKKKAKKVVDEDVDIEDFDELDDEDYDDFDDEDDLLDDDEEDVFAELDEVDADEEVIDDDDDVIDDAELEADEEFELDEEEDLDEEVEDEEEEL